MSLVVVVVIIGLAVVWKYSIPGDDGTEAGWLGPLYNDKADPGTTNFIPRPDWYFYFLFYLLRIFKWPDSVILAHGRDPDDPDGAALRAAVHRHAARAAAVAPAGRGRRGGADGDLDGRAHLQGRDGARVAADGERRARRRVGRAPGLRGQRGCATGAELFAGVGCQQCHTYLGAGLVEPRRARPLRDRRVRAGRSTTSSATSPTRRSSATT